MEIKTNKGKMDKEATSKKLSKNKKIILSVVLILAIAGIIGSVGALNGWFGTAPVAHWRFEEGSGTTAYDATSNNNDLTLVNTPTWTTSGKFGSALDFESSSSEYGYIADNSSLSLTGDLTISVWIKPESTTAATLFDIAGKWDGANESYLLAQYCDEIRMYIDAAANYVTTNSAKDRKSVVRERV